MIARFSVSNFLSIREKQAINFLTTKDKTNKDLMAVEVANGIYINKMAIFFGANASGKSNILKALETIFMMLSTPTADPRLGIRYYTPFEQDNNSPVSMAIEFYYNGVKYNYDIRYNGRYIEEENLFYTPRRSKALFYSRQYAGEGVQPTITFGNSLNIKQKTKGSIRENTFNNNSVLSTAAKISLPDDAREFVSLHVWIEKYVHNINGDRSINSYTAELNSINADLNKKKFYINLLAKADFNIVDFKIVDNRATLPKEIVKTILTNSAISEEDRVDLLNKVVFTNRSEKGNFDISIDYQSEGTLRFIELMNVLYDLITGNHIYFLDELGNRMHYDLIVYYLMLFLYNSDSSQLFFTSQSVLLLDEDFIRRDAVYLTEKDIETASSSYKRVSDMGLHKNLSLYNAYRIGKLGSRPELGSPYLNV